MYVKFQYAFHNIVHCNNDVLTSFIVNFRFQFNYDRFVEAGTRRFFRMLSRRFSSGSDGAEGATGGRTAKYEHPRGLLIWSIIVKPAHTLAPSVLFVTSALGRVVTNAGELHLDRLLNVLIFNFCMEIIMNARLQTNIESFWFRLLVGYEKNILHI